MDKKNNLFSNNGELLLLGDIVYFSIWNSLRYKSGISKGRIVKINAKTVSILSQEDTTHVVYPYLVYKEVN